MSQQSQLGTAGLEDSWVAPGLLCTVYFGILDGFSSNKQKSSLPCPVMELPPEGALPCFTLPWPVMKLPPEGALPCFTVGPASNPKESLPYPAACILLRCSQNRQLTPPLGPSPQKLRPFGPAPFQMISWGLITCSAFSTQPNPPIHSASHLLEVLKISNCSFSFHEPLVLSLHLRPFVF